MLFFLPPFLRGIIGLILISLSIILFPFLIVFVGTLKLLIPIPAWRRFSTHLLHETIPYGWILANDFIFWLTTKTKIEIQGSGHLSKKEWYFVIANHNSYLDILILESVFHRRIPMLKFFMKQELLWSVPVMGVACWMMGFPFMKRYSKTYLKKHPEKKGADLETTRKACKGFREYPSSVINFLEGTRFTTNKHAAQKSPFKYLLRPKAGGFAFVLKAMEGSINHIVDVTVIYPQSKINFWQFLCGKVKKIIIHYEVLPVPEELLGHYYEDSQFRQQFQRWLNQRWELKDQLIDKLK
jgi:1-acyl-sn-glycerol-3-phosphate acyltransferase